jgi:hypothetical protein
MDVIAQDFYYGGPGDIVTGLTVTPLGERFYGVPNDVPGKTYDPAGLAVYDFGPSPATARNSACCSSPTATAAPATAAAPRRRPKRCSSSRRNDSWLAKILAGLWPAGA